MARKKVLKEKVDAVKIVDRKTNKNKNDKQMYWIIWVMIFLVFLVLMIYYIKNSVNNCE